MKLRDLTLMLFSVSVARTFDLFWPLRSAASGCFASWALWAVIGSIYVWIDFHEWKERQR